MICYKCHHEAGKSEMCPLCGADLSVFQKVIRLSNVYYNDGLRKAEVRNLSGAIISLKKSIKFNKYNTAARNLLGLVYYEMGETVDALTEWVISKNYQEKDNIAEKYLEEIRQNRGLLAANNQTIKKYNQALLYCKQDSRDLAIIQLKKVLSLNPKLVKGHQLLALLYLQEDKLDLAKKYIRNAGKIDNNNTITLRYLKEVNARLKAQGDGKKKKDDDLISYQSGNETIIMPKKFQDFSIGRILSYILIGLAVGAAIIGALVVPEVQRQSKQDYDDKLVEIYDSLSTTYQTIEVLQEEIKGLEAELEQAIADKEAAWAVTPEQIEAYDTLLSAFLAHSQDDYLTVGNQLNKVDVTQLRDSAVEMYNSLWEMIAEDYYATLYANGYTFYTEDKFSDAIASLQPVVDYNKDYEEGYAVYYLAHAYRRDGDGETAKQYYQYIIEKYPDTKLADTAKKYVD